MSASEAYEAKRQEVVLLVWRLKDLIAAHVKAQAASPNVWGFVGDLAHIEIKLREVINFLDVRTPTK